MALIINGTFSEQDEKILKSAPMNLVVNTKDGHDGNQAHSEHGGLGLSYAISFWRLIDKEKADKFKELLESAPHENDDSITVYSPETVRKVLTYLSELDSKLKEFFGFDGTVKAEKLEYVKSVLSEYMIKTTEKDGKKVDTVLEPLSRFQDAKTYFEIAVKLNREIMHY